MKILKHLTAHKLIQFSACVFLINSAHLTNVFAADNPPPPDSTGGGISDADFDVKEIATFQLAEQKYRIWSSLRNDQVGAAQQWEFLIEPLFQPIWDGDKPEVEVVGSNVYFDVALWSDEAVERALTAIQETYPDNAKDIGESHVSPIPIKSITLESQDVAAIDPGATLDATVPIGGLPKRIRFRIRASSPLRAADIASQFTGLEITYHALLSARVALRASAKLQGNQALMASFRTSLNGTPPTADGNRYVQRLDFRKFLADKKQEVLANVVIDQGALADPEEFFRSVFEEFMDRWDTLSSANFEQLSNIDQQSTFNQNDLTPDKLTQEINKIFTYDQGTKEFKVSGSGDIGGGVSIGPISANDKVSGSYSQDDVQSWLRKNDIDAEWQGEKWVVKDVVVRQVNDTAINSLSSDLISFTQILPAETKEEVGQLPLGTTTSDGVDSLGGRIENLEQALKSYSTLPVGTVLPYNGKPSALDGSGWVICDATNANLYPGVVPNLENRFLEGVGYDAFGSVGGRKDIPPDGGGTPSGSVSLNTHWRHGHGDGVSLDGNHFMPDMAFSGNPMAPHNHGGENRPPFYTLYYIIRIR